MASRKYLVPRYPLLLRLKPCVQSFQSLKPPDFEDLKTPDFKVPSQVQNYRFLMSPLIQGGLPIIFRMLNYPSKPGPPQIAESYSFLFNLKGSASKSQASRISSFRISDLRSPDFKSSSQAKNYRFLMSPLIRGGLPIIFSKG